VMQNEVNTSILSLQKKAHVFRVVSPTLASSALFQHEGRKKGW